MAAARLHAATLVSLVCATFATAAIAKVLSYDELLASLHVSHLFPAAVVAPFACLLVLAEFLIAVLSVVPQTRQLALYTAT